MRPELLLKCCLCGKEFLRNKREVDRQRRNGKKNTFCSLACSCKFGNLAIEKPIVERECPTCGTKFTVKATAKAAHHCSRSCASLNSVTDKRRKGSRAGGLASVKNLIRTDQALKLRESWKYAELKQVLDETGFEHEFEFFLEGFVFDLYLPSMKIIVEFDGPDHGHTGQRAVDVKKELIASKQGIRVIRSRVEPAKVIPASALEPIFD